MDVRRRSHLREAHRNIHACTLQYMLWFTARVEDLHLSRCVDASVPSFRKDKNHWPVIHCAHRHWHASSQRIPLFHPPSRFCLKTFPFLLHLLPFHLSKAKETETEIQRGELVPRVPLSLLCWKAEFHWKMFGIVFRRMKLPKPNRVWCDIFGRTGINSFTRNTILLFNVEAATCK